MEILTIAPVRVRDTWGEGRFGAPRGNRTHRGVDYCAAVGSVVLSPITGHVTKLGYPYGDDLSYRYVQVTTPDGRRHRFFYVEPEVELGEFIIVNDWLGTVQDIVRRYPVPRGMKNHFHYEIIDKDGVYIDPEGDDV